MLMVQLAPRQQRLPRVEVDRLAFVPVKEFVFRDIEMKATRQSRAREWIIEGAVLPRHLPADAGIHAEALHQFGKRLKCGGCGAFWREVELIMAL